MFNLRNALTNTTPGLLAVALAIPLPLLTSAAEVPTSIQGRWSATLNDGKATIPFRLDITGDANHLVGTLFNGQDTETTTAASFRDGHLQLEFQHYLTVIDATLQDKELEGKVIAKRRSSINITPGAAEQAARDSEKSFHAIRYVAPKVVAGERIPNIDGVWEIPHESNKGEKAWRLIVQQKGSEIVTTVLRVDGDTGAMTGAWQDGKFVASHFDGARPGLIQLVPNSDGSLAVNLHAEPRNLELIAYRPEVARAKGFPEPANFLTHTSVRDPNEVFAYSFKDVTGRLISNEDPQYRGKVVLAIVTGTWCPNCHDEAQYLVQLYSQYHAKGLEIVALDFEEADQAQSLTRVNAFISKYKVPYRYLIAGTPDEMWDKVPQAVNLNTWPATFFIGKDGKVKAVYSGFAAQASGVYHKALEHDFRSTIERLLAQPESSGTSAAIQRKPEVIAQR